MAAPSLAALLNFEDQFEDAAQAILESAGVVSFVSQSKDKLPLINTGVGFECGAALDQLTFLPLASGQTQPSEQEYFRYVGNLELRIEVNRDTERAPLESTYNFLGTIRGLVRGSFLYSQWPFDDTNLPWLRVSDLRPNGSSTGFEAARNIDSFIQRYQVTFAINPAAWPTGFPPS